MPQLTDPGRRQPPFQLEAKFAGAVVANTLEWFTPSPPPENNFDVIPRVRSVEPMKDIRRQVEQETGVEQRYQAGRPVANV